MIHTKWDCGEVLRGRHFTLVVIGCIVTHFHRPPAHGIKNFEGRNEFTTTVNLDLQAAGRGRFDSGRKIFHAHARTRIPRRP